MDLETKNVSKQNWTVLFWPIGVLVILLLALIVWQKGFDLKKSYGNDKPQNVLSISAEGKVKAVPDTATVSLGVIAKGSDPKKVAEDASAKINQIIEYAKSLGVQKEDITTTQSSIDPEYNWQDGGQRIIGYQTNQTVTVKVRGVDKSTEVVTTLIGGAVEHGANSVYGSQFSIDDPDGLRQEARKLAIAKAKEKAKELADEAGIKLGKVVSISESGNGGYLMPLYAETRGMGGAVMMDEKAVTAPNIEVGSQEIIQSMTVTLEIK